MSSTTTSRLNTTTRAYFFDRLAYEIREMPTDCGAPAFKSTDLTRVYQDAVLGRRRLHADEEGELVEKLTGNNRAVLSLALYFLKHNKLHDAATLADRLGHGEHGLLLRAAIAADKRQIDSALTALRGVLELQPRVARYHLLAGLAYAASGASEHSIFHLFRALRLNPSRDSNFDELISLLPVEDDRRRLIVQLRERAAEDRKRWIQPLDAYFTEPNTSDRSASQEEAAGGPVTEDFSTAGIAGLYSLSRVSRDLEDADDTFDVPFDVSADDFSKAKGATQRAQIAATLYKKATASRVREKVRWLGSYAFAKADSLKGDERNHYLLTFLLCSYFGGTDEIVREIALRNYIEGSGSRVLRNDPLQSAQLFVREPLGPSTIWAARLVVAMPAQFISAGLQLAHRQRVTLALTLVLCEEEPDALKLSAIELFLGRKLTDVEHDLATSALSLVRRISSLPQHRDRLTGIVDLKDLLARIDGNRFAVFLVELFERSIKELEREVTSSLKRQAPPLSTQITTDTTPGGLLIITVRVRNDGNVELRNVSIGVDVEGFEKGELSWHIPSLSAGETAAFASSKRHSSGRELVATARISSTSSASEFSVQEKFVLASQNAGLPLDPVENPYLTGMPIPPGNQMFFGRHQELVKLSNLTLAARAAHVPVVFGQRRTGKTSLLNRLSVEPAVAREFDFVLLDCERASGADTAGFASFVSEELSLKLEVPDSFVTERAHFVEDPLGVLRTNLNMLGHKRRRRVLIAIDEFETLIAGIRDNRIATEILGLFRSFMQHHPTYSFIVAGADELVERARSYASPLFGLMRPLRIQYLENDDLAQLLDRPMRKAISVDADVVPQMKSLCNGHPYLAQLLCHYVIDQLNEVSRRRMTSLDVDLAADTIITSDDAYFYEIYNDRCSLQDRVVLSAIAELAQKQSGRVPYDAIYQLLRANDHSMRPESLSSLEDRQLIDVDPHARTCVFRLEMLRRWIVRKHPFEAQRRVNV